MSDAAAIAHGLGAKRAGKGWIACCPAHDDKEPSLSISRGTKRTLLHCFAGCDIGAVTDALAARGLWTSGKAEARTPWTPPAAKPAKAPAQSATFFVAKRLAAKAVPIVGTIAETYLSEHRRIPKPAAGWPSTIGFVADHYKGADQRLLVISATDDADALQGVQTIALDAAGAKDKTLGKRVKRSLGPITQGLGRLPGTEDITVLAEGPETGLTVWAATGYSTFITFGSVDRYEPGPGETVFVCLDDDRDAKKLAKLEARFAEWRAGGARVFAATAWAERDGSGRDFNDLAQAEGVEAVAQRIQAALATPEPAQAAPEPAQAPHYPRRKGDAETASRRLRRAVGALLDRVQRRLDARDWIEAEAVRIEPAVEADLAARIAKKLKTQGVEGAEDIAAEQASKMKGRTAKARARRLAIAKFGARNVRGDMPRLQIAGSASLGKTVAMVEAYAARPGLWKRHIAVLAPDFELVSELEKKFLAAIARTPPAADGSKPRVQVIRGRTAKGMCDKDRAPLAEKLSAAGCGSIHRSLCHTPAVGDRPESFCPAWNWCKAEGYVSQFEDKTPALRIMAHARLTKRQPNDLRLPPADLVAVDEGALGAMIHEGTVKPATLTNPATYASKPGEEAKIQEAIDYGQIIVDALDKPDLVQELREAKVTPKDLREAAEAATAAADAAAPKVLPGMTAKMIARAVEGHEAHPGRTVASLLRQLARDIEAGRRRSNGVEWDPRNALPLRDGGTVAQPVLRIHGKSPALAVSPRAGLLLLDADANLDIGRQLFGASLRNATIEAARQTYTIQIFDAAMAKVTLAPAESLSQERPAELRQAVRIMVQREAAGGKRVLAVTPLQVRRALTGEKDSQVEPSTTWAGATITHFGRHRGVDLWKDYDTVILIGREQLSPIQAERMARAVWADADGVELVTLPHGANLPKELRAHDMRHGTAPPVKVSVHPDPRVQSIIELSRERALGQGADRLRPIHRDPNRPVRVLAFSNIPIPGLVVDELVSTEDMLAGGTVWQRLAARLPGGVMPLVPAWLCSNFNDLFPGLRATKDHVAGVAERVQVHNTNLHCEPALFPEPLSTPSEAAEPAVAGLGGKPSPHNARQASFRLEGQRCPSRCLVRADLSEPEARAELTRLMGRPVVAFTLAPEPRQSANQPAQNAAAATVPAEPLDAAQDAALPANLEQEPIPMTEPEAQPAVAATEPAVPPWRQPQPPRPPAPAWTAAAEARWQAMVWARSQPRSLEGARSGR